MFNTKQKRIFLPAAILFSFIILALPNIVFATSSLWVFTIPGHLYSYNSEDGFTDYGEKDFLHSYDVIAVDGKLWVPSKYEAGGFLVCDSMGECTDVIYDENKTSSGVGHVAEFDNKIWFSTGYSNLYSCTSSGLCENHGRISSSNSTIQAMGEFDGKLWIGTYDGELMSCDSSANCTGHGYLEGPSFEIQEFDGKLWISVQDGDLFSCDTSGNCTYRISLGSGEGTDNRILRMATYDNKLWLNLFSGEVFSCNSDLECTNHGNRGYSQLKVHDGLIWNGDIGSFNYCDENLNCTDVEDTNDLRYIIIGGLSSSDDGGETDDNSSSSLSGSSWDVCTDSDGGKSYHTKGETQNEGGGLKIDSCYCSVDGSITNLETCEEGPYVGEWYCGYRNTATLENDHICLYGCRDGACLESPEVDDDGNEDNNTEDEVEEEEKKVTICHVPSGNEENAQTISVTVSAVQDMLDKGSYLGKCIDRSKVASLWLGGGRGVLYSYDSNEGVVKYGKDSTRIANLVDFGGRIWFESASESEVIACEYSGECQAYKYSDRHHKIFSMAVFNDRIWLGHMLGHLYSCSADGECVYHGQKDPRSVNDMKVFAGKLWLGMGSKLLSCDTYGNCIDHNVSEGVIYSMEVFDDKLWLGEYRGRISTCDSEGNCEFLTRVGNSKESAKNNIYSMQVFADQLWLGLAYDGELVSCNSEGKCVSHGNKKNGVEDAAGITDMEVSACRLWLAQDEGFLQSCDENGNCISHELDKVDSDGIASLLDRGTNTSCEYDLDDKYYEEYVPFSDSLWIGRSDGNLFMHVLDNNFTDYGYTGSDIQSMVYYNDKVWMRSRSDEGEVTVCDSRGECRWFVYKFTSIYENVAENTSMVVFDDKIWFGHRFGDLYSCDTKGECFYHGDYGETIGNMLVYEDKLWLIQHSKIQSCDADLNCVEYTDDEGHFGAIEIFDNKMWIGRGGRNLSSCDANFNCTSYGSVGSHENPTYNNIQSMEVMGNKLWLGLAFSGELVSCDSEGNCTSHGYKNDSWARGANIMDMQERKGRLWLAQPYGVLRACNNDGTCIRYKVGEESHLDPYGLGTISHQFNALFDAGELLESEEDDNVNEEDKNNKHDKSDENKQNKKEEITSCNECSEENSNKDVEVSEIVSRTKLLVENSIEKILEAIGEKFDTRKEKDTKEKYLNKLKGNEKLSENIETVLNNFLTYGVDINTKKLGTGERAAALSSYKRAFGSLPQNEEEITDVIKISNGRWPGQVSEKGEAKSKEIFKQIYKREADMNNPQDNAAVTIMTYGLRQKAENRNLNSEKQGIKIFTHIFGYTPRTSEDWDIMQGITYSGAKR